MCQKYMPKAVITSSADVGGVCDVYSQHGGTWAVVQELMALLRLVCVARHDWYSQHICMHCPPMWGGGGGRDGRGPYSEVNRCYSSHVKWTVQWHNWIVFPQDPRYIHWMLFSV